MWVRRDRPDRADQAQHLEQGEEQDQVGQARRHAAEQQHGCHLVGHAPWRCRSLPARPAAARRAWPSRSPAPSSRNRGTSGFPRTPWRSSRGSARSGQKTGGQAVLSMSYLSDNETIQKKTKQARRQQQRRPRAPAPPCRRPCGSFAWCEPSWPWRQAHFAFWRAHSSTSESATMMAKNTTTTADAVPT